MTSFFNFSFKRIDVNQVCLGLCILLAVILLFAPDVALAGGGTGMPYESGLEKLQKSLTGPWAMLVSVVAIIAAGCGLMIGGDLNGFIKSLLLLVVVITLIVNAAAFAGLLGAKDAMINSAEQVNPNIASERISKNDIYVLNTHVAFAKKLVV